MFGAIGRWLKAMMYLFTGRLDAARRALDTNPHVVRAKYDDIIREKVSSIHTYKQAVAGLIAQQEGKMAKVKTLTAEVERLERLKAGALAKAKQSVAKLQKDGKAKEEIQRDADYRKCLSAFNDFSSTLNEKQDRITELEQDVDQYRQRIGEHKVQLQGLLREIESLKSESADAVADMITAKQEKEIGDTLAGIAKDGTAEELQRMRQLRQEVKAEARISKELSGVEAKSQEEEFLEYARTSSADSEFDALVGLSEAKDAGPREKESRGPEGPSKLPE
jgi:phage shock protein A